MTESTYRSIVEEMLGGKTKRLGGISIHTARKALQAAKRKLYAEAADSGFPLPQMDIIVRVEQDGTLTCTMQEPQRGFSRKLQILE